MFSVAVRDVSSSKASIIREKRQDFAFNIANHRLQFNSIQYW